MSDLDRMRRAGREAGDSPIPSQGERRAAIDAEYDPMSRESRAAMAERLWRGAEDFGRIIAAVEQMGNRGWSVIDDESEGADAIVIDGPKLARTLNSMAMRLDRAIAIKMGKDD